jgi:hypothetical protein
MDPDLAPNLIGTESKVHRATWRGPSAAHPQGAGVCGASSPGWFDVRRCLLGTSRSPSGCEMCSECLRLCFADQLTALVVATRGAHSMGQDRCRAVRTNTELRRGHLVVVGASHVAFAAGRTSFGLSHRLLLLLKPGFEVAKWREPRIERRLPRFGDRCILNGRAGGGERRVSLKGNATQVLSQRKHRYLQ